MKFHSPQRMSRGFNLVDSFLHPSTNRLRSQNRVAQAKWIVASDPKRLAARAGPREVDRSHESSFEDVSIHRSALYPEEKEGFHHHSCQQQPRPGGQVEIGTVDIPSSSLLVRSLPGVESTAPKRNGRQTEGRSRLGAPFHPMRDFYACSARRQRSWLL